MHDPQLPFSHVFYNYWNLNTLFNVTSDNIKKTVRILHNLEIKNWRGFLPLVYKTKEDRKGGTGNKSK